MPIHQMIWQWLMISAIPVAMASFGRDDFGNIGVNDILRLAAFFLFFARLFPGDMILLTRRHPSVLQPVEYALSDQCGILRSSGATLLVFQSVTFIFLSLSIRNQNLFMPMLMVVTSLNNIWLGLLILDLVKFLLSKGRQRSKAHEEVFIEDVRTALRWFFNNGVFVFACALGYTFWQNNSAWGLVSLVLAITSSLLDFLFTGHFYLNTSPVPPANGADVVPQA